METAKVKNKKMMSLAILFVSALQMGGMGLMPSLAAIQADFPEVPTTVIQTMANWPGFAMLLGCAISTMLATKVSKKVLCQIGVACSTSIGLLGFFFNSSIFELFAWQTVLGLGFGLLMPTSSGIIAEQYAEEERAKLIGTQNLFANGGGIYLTYVGGALAAVNWHMNYLAYLIGLIPLVLGCIYLPNDKPTVAGNAPKEQFKVAPKTWFYGVLIFVFINTYNVFSNNISFVIQERGIGSAAVAGTAMSLFLVGGMLGGLMFGPAEGKLHDYTICLSFIALSVGLLMIYFTGSIIVVYIAAVIAGLSIGFAMPLSLLGATNCNTVAAATVACAIVQAAGQLGTVCSPWTYTPAAALFSDSVSFRYLFAAIVSIILCVLVAIAITVVNKNIAKKAA